MSSSGRWKLACGLLAALTLYAWIREPVASVPPTKQLAKRAGHRGPVRVSASALGVSTAELVEQLLEARTALDMKPIAEKLGMAGGDEIVEPLRPLLTDTRDGVRDLVIDLYGKVGTDAAVETLIEIVKERTSTWSALYALGDSGHPKAETFLIELLGRHPTYESIDALGKYHTETAARALARAVTTVPEDLLRYVLDKLGDMPVPEARAALRALIDSPSVSIASRAIDALDEIDDETIVKLSSIVKAGDSELGRSAVSALGRAGEAAADILVEIASEGVGDLRIDAVRALGKVKTQRSFDALVALAEAEDGSIGEYALEAIGALDMPGSRDLLISVAMSERPLAGSALNYLADLDGEEVDSALVEIAKSDAKVATSALSRLLSREHPDAIQMVVARASRGTDDERIGAMELLSNAATPAAIDKLIELVRGTDGPLKVRSLSLLGRRPEPAIAHMLTDSLRSADPAEAAAAASVLASTGTPQARDALLLALDTKDADLLYATVRALESYRLDDAAAAALARAADGNEAIAPYAMRKLLAAGSSHGTHIAEQAINSDNRDVAIRAVEMLREVGSPASHKLIEEAVHTTEGDVRATAVRVLGDSRDPRSIDVLRSALDDSDQNVRENVAYALRAIGGEKARDVLIDMTRSSAPNDRVAALSNLRDIEDRVTTQRIRELVRDPDASVSLAAMRTLANSTTGAVDLRAIALDGSAPQTLRYEAALTLQRYDQLDERTSAWLASATAQADGGEYIIVE